MAFEIAYRDCSYREGIMQCGRRVRLVEARVGDMSARGANKTEAKAELLAQIEQQLTHLYRRRYLSTNEVTFCLYYLQGWCYDIVQPGNRLSCTTGLGADLTELEAMDRMRHHFEQYTEV